MKKILSRIFNTLPKRVIAGVAIATAIVLPVATSAATAVTIEGSIGVANVTAGDNTYSHSVNASYDQVVKFQVYYHNRELADSGKIAQNLRVKINMPTQAGTTQTVSTKISADNSNTITDSSTVHLDRGDAYLQYIPGSAVWKHNTGTNSHLNIVETKVSDNVVYGGQGLVLENEKPCYNFAATVTVLARVMVPGVSIDKQVEKLGQSNAWTTNNTANPGDTLKYLISYKNTGNSVQNQVILRDNLPPKMTLVPGTTYLADASHPSGVKVDDTITQGGVNAGNFGAGANAFVTFQVKVPEADQLACGDTEFRNVGVVRPQGMNEYYNTAVTTVTKQCQPSSQPSYSCDMLDIKPGSGRSVTVSNFKYTALNGATFSSAVVDWGDGSSPLTTDSVVGKSHTYAKDGSYTVSAVAHFAVNGADASADGVNCSKTVSFTTPKHKPTITKVGGPTVTTNAPTQLVNTGPGGVMAAFAAVTVLGAVMHRLFLSRRLARQ